MLCLTCTKWLQLQALVEELSCFLGVETTSRPGWQAWLAGYCSGATPPGRVELQQQVTALENRSSRHVTRRLTPPQQLRKVTLAHENNVRTSNARKGLLTHRLDQSGD